MITSKRLPNGQHAVLKDGQRVGEAWRFLKVSGRPRTPGFGLRLTGFYWRDGVAVQAGAGKGGRSCASAPRLLDALDLARRTLEPGS